MKKRNSFLLLVAFALSASFSSCTENNEIGTPENSTANIIGRVDGYTTRAANDAWGSTDKIGVSATNDLNTYTNVPYDYDADDNFAAESDPIKFKYQSLGYDFTAYYPYHDTEDETSFDIDTRDQSVTSGNANSPLNIMYATGAHASSESPTVNLQFNHKMARVVFTIKPGDGMTIGEINDPSTVLKVSGLKHDGSFDYTTGVVSLDGDAAAADDVVINSAQQDQSVSVAYVAYYIPQTLNSFDLKINIGGEDYTLTVPVPQSGLQHLFEAAKSYNFSISIDADHIRITDTAVTGWTPTITQWTNVDGGSDLTAIQHA